MRVLIIEDEPLARRSLIHLLRELDGRIEIVGEVDSIAYGRTWLAEHGVGVDLAFCDIHLGDGSSFQLFETHPPAFPVVFTTAYDEYALQAFSVRSLDYLLKPLKRTDLERALDRYRAATTPAGPTTEDIRHLLREAVRRPEQDYRQSFLWQRRHHLVPVATTELRCLYILNDIVYGQTLTGDRYIINEKLEEVAGQVDPAQFFRVNRQLVVHRQAVKSLAPEVNGRYLLTLKPTGEAQDPIGEGRVKATISKAKVREFREWLVR